MPKTEQTSPLQAAPLKAIQKQRRGSFLQWDRK